MPKADSTNTTPCRSPLATPDSQTAAYALGGTPGTPAFAAPDPLVALCQQIRDFDSAQDPIDAKASELRAALTARYGAPTKWRAADDLWGGDPLLVELTRLNVESDERTRRILALTEQVKKTPATTSAGLLAKLKLAISLFPRPMLEGHHDLHEAFAQATLKDAARLLEREAAGEPDAELISNCAEMVALEHEWQKAGPNEDGEYPERPERWDDLLNKVTETEAVTEAGRRAKLSVVVAFFEPDGPDYRSVVDELLWDAVEALAMPPATLKRFAPAEPGA